MLMDEKHLIRRTFDGTVETSLTYLYFPSKPVPLSFS